MIMLWLLTLTTAYLLGSIPFGYLLVRFVREEDVRSTGSGNVLSGHNRRNGRMKNFQHHPNSTMYASEKDTGRRIASPHYPPFAQFKLALSLTPMKNGEPGLAA